MQALERIGVRKAVAELPAIGAQLRVLSTTNNLAPELRRGLEELLKSLR